jgi:hypothetical protein
MANTYTQIASSTVGSGGAATIDFTSIPSTYTDLCIKFSLRTNAVDNTGIKLNGVATNMTSKRLYGSGTAATSDSRSDMVIILANNNTDTANTFSNGEFYIPNYAGNSNKSVSADSVQENNGTTGYAMLSAGLWSSTAAINQVTIYLISTANYVQYSTATLYGIKNS